MDLTLAQTYASAAEAHLKQGQTADAIEACQKGENAVADARRFAPQRTIDYEALAQVEAELYRLRQTAERLSPEPTDPMDDSADFAVVLQRRYSDRASWLPLKHSPAGDLEEIREEPLDQTDGFEVTTWRRREELGQSTFRRVRLSPAREQWFQQIPPGPHQNDAAILKEEREEQQGEDRDEHEAVASVPTNQIYPPV